MGMARQMAVGVLKARTKKQTNQNKTNKKTKNKEGCYSSRCGMPGESLYSGWVRIEQGGKQSQCLFMLCEMGDHSWQTDCRCYFSVTGKNGIPFLKSVPASPFSFFFFLSK